MQVNASFVRLLSYNRPELGWGIAGLCGSVGSGVVMPIFALAFSSVVAVFFNPNKTYMKHQIASKHFHCLTMRGQLLGFHEESATCVLIHLSCQLAVSYAPKMAKSSFSGT